MTCDERRDTIPLDAVDPYHLRVDLLNQDVYPADFDFTDVTGAQFRVTKPDGTEVVWSAQIEQVTATSIRIAHLFATGDVNQLGEYRVRPELIITAGGPLFGRLVWFTVTPK